ncbi:hypothetical protein CSA17_04660 [bacterium DOLJORAL78_65_58]|nr:MAG: hypothetical protein CSB20_02235 [bacterium DOLZORAL124_64_63]PIE75986.1 MAG: hypothetical protein CSA17_04660 [bacterium DOLJORAL78_65_58]
MAKNSGTESPSTVNAPADEVCWPLDLPTRYLTSNFMEYRGGRYHAGLDLKTQSREGFAVRAVEDGYIARLRCTPTAYGRVVYLRGDSGRTFVFAHLQRFNDDLRQRVRLNQEASGKYRTSLYFQADEIRVRKGDVLGLSGQSGTGGPHLHFEVRDRNQRPMDPQALGFAVSDDRAPVIHSLRAWPASSGARVFGQEGEWLCAADGGQGRQGDLGLQGDLGALAVSGPVAFSARIVEATDVAGHKLEPWLIELRLDGDVVYRCANEVFAFDENAQQRLEWTDAADWTDKGVPREHWLHRRAAVTLPGREGDLWYLGDDGQGLAAGLHHLELRARDRAGNTAAVRWQMLVTEQMPAADKISAPEKSRWRKAPLGVRFSRRADLALTPFFSAGDPAAQGLARLMFTPGQDPVLEPLEMWAGLSAGRPVGVDVARGQGLRSVGRQARFLAADWPVGSSLPVVWPDTIAAPGKGRRLGLYRWQKKGQWGFVESVAPGAATEVHLEDPGIHGIFQDVEGPVLQSNDQVLAVNPAPQRAVPGVTLPRWTSTPLAAFDAGCGLDTGSLACTLDGGRLIVEPDPPRDRVLVHWPDEMAPGKHELVVTVKDRAGNAARKTYGILCAE